VKKLFATMDSSGSSGRVKPTLSRLRVKLSEWFFPTKGQFFSSVKGISGNSGDPSRIWWLLWFGFVGVLS
jgi:hypothetical protein